MKNKSRLVFFALICLIVAIVLMALPYGVIMRWSAPPGETYAPTYYSYFSLTPYAYGHFFPPITAIVTVVSAAIILLHIFLNKFRLGALILTLVASMCSALALIIPFNITVISIIVTILLASSAALQARLHLKKG